MGEAAFTVNWPAGLPSGLEIYAQLLWMTEPATTCADSPLNVVSSRGLIVTLLP